MAQYRDPRPYRKPQSYRGLETAPGAGPPSVCAEFGLPWSVGNRFAAVHRFPWLDAPHRAHEPKLPWGEADRFGAQTSLPWLTAAQFDERTRIRWARRPKYRKRQPYRKARSYRGTEAVGKIDYAASTAIPWGTPGAFDTSYAVPYGPTSLREALGYVLPFRQASASAETYRVPYGTPAQHNAQLSLLWKALAARGAFIAIPWGPAGRYERPYGLPWPIEPEPPPGTPITVPILPVYYMIPNLTVVRLPEGTPIHALSCTVSTDLRSWAWSFTMAIPYSELALVNPSNTAEPIEIEIEINGYVWTMMVESFQDQLRFGSRAVTVTGRSRSAILAQPYAPLRSYTETAARDASQLADRELDGTGWTLVWDAVDWLVPGNTFSYSDLAPIDAIARVANAIGASLHSDAEAKTLNVIPGYEVSPWAWGTTSPFAIIPANILTQGDGSLAGGINANGVYVYSQNATFGALVKITGTGGEVQIPMIVDPLIVDADSAQERGRIELARAGRIKNETRVMPLFPQPHLLGLVPIGKLLEFEEAEGTWRGQVVGISISAQRSGQASSVRQTLTLERQFRE